MGIQFHDKENHSYEENERCNIYLSIPNIKLSLSRGHQRVQIMTHYCYFLMASEKCRINI